MTLFEMATATLPSCSDKEGLPVLIEDELEIDSGVFDPSIREAMADFFRKALSRDVQQRFDNAEEMLRAWRQIFLQAGKETSHSETETPAKRFSPEEASLNTQVGLLDLTPQALDTLGRLNINRVDELIRLPLNELVRMTGVGTNTRRELSDLVQKLRTRFESQPEPGKTLTLHTTKDASWPDRVIGCSTPRTEARSISTTTPAMPNGITCFRYSRAWNAFPPWGSCWTIARIPFGGCPCRRTGPNSCWISSSASIRKAAP